MTDPDSLRRQLLSKFDDWLPDIAEGKVVMLRLAVRPYRKAGEEVELLQHKTTTPVRRVPA